MSLHPKNEYRNEPKDKVTPILVAIIVVLVTVLFIVNLLGLNR